MQCINRLIFSTIIIMFMPSFTHFSLKISIPLGGHEAAMFTLLSTMAVDSPFDTNTEKG